MASPAGAQSLPTCSLNPVSMNLASGGSGTAVLTVTTTAASAASARLNFWPMGGGSILAALIMFGIPSRRHRWASALMVLLVMAGVGVIGCGGGGARCEPEICATHYAGYNRRQLYIYPDGDRRSQFEAHNLY